MKKKIIKESKGITLIALVVTIIVLLILSGVAINLTIGSNGIFSRASEAVIVNENAEVYEQLQFKVLDYQLDNVQTDEENIILEKLLEDGYIDENNILNIEQLMGKSMKTGNGNTEDGDIYFLLEDENNSETYNLMYYNSNKKFKNLGKAFSNSTQEDYLEPTPDEYFEFDEATGSIALKDADSYYYSNTERVLGFKTLVIPSTYNGSEVKKIGINGAKTISCLKDVETIVIPSSVKVLGTRAFYKCIGLKNIIIPDSVTIIDNMAFDTCSKLTSINIPKSVTTIGGYAFDECTSLETINVSFNKGEQPAGWDSDWRKGCNAKIVYANGETELFLISR